MATLKETLRTTMQGYAGRGLNGISWLTIDENNLIYAIVSISQQPNGRYVDVGLLVRLTSQHIIIEYDMNNKPLVDALLQAGIARQQIILAYQGEVAPDAVF